VNGKGVRLTKNKNDNVIRSCRIEGQKRRWCGGGGGGGGGRTAA
jgi:hypothetical protein